MPSPNSPPAPASKRRKFTDDDITAAIRKTRFPTFRSISRELGTPDPSHLKGRLKAMRRLKVIGYDCGKYTVKKRRDEQ